MRLRPILRTTALLTAAVAALALFAAAYETTPSATDPLTQVETLLAEQAAAWSRGDLETFVAAYADDVLFLSPSGVTQGKQQVLERYRTRYPDGAAMGRLTLEPLDTRAADDGAAVSVAARWTLSYPDGERDEATGLTLVVLMPDGAGGWRIVHDASM